MQNFILWIFRFIQISSFSLFLLWAPNWAFFLKDIGRFFVLTIWSHWTGGSSATGLVQSNSSPTWYAVTPRGTWEILRGTPYIHKDLGIFNKNVTNCLHKIHWRTRGTREKKAPLVHKLLRTLSQMWTDDLKTLSTVFIF